MDSDDRNYPDHLEIAQKWLNNNYLGDLPERRGRVTAQIKSNQFVEFSLQPDHDVCMGTRANRVAFCQTSVKHLDYVLNRHLVAYTQLHERINSRKQP